MAGATLTLCVSLGTFVTVYWGDLQLGYIRLLPPDHYGFLNDLEKPPYRGATFVANNYAVPIVSKTGNWAYFDPKLADGNVTLSHRGYEARRDLTYLWMADRRANPAYLTPDYFLCSISQNFQTVLTDLQSKGEKPPWCSLTGMVQRARSPHQNTLKHRVVAASSGKSDKWTIVKLDWDYPPYLRTSNGDKNDGKEVTLRITRYATGIIAAIDYSFAHRKNVREAQSMVRLYRTETRSGACPDGGAHWSMMKERVGAKRFFLPDDANGFIRVSVTPATASKRGPEYFSRAVAPFGGPVCH